MRLEHCRQSGWSRCQARHLRIGLPRSISLLEAKRINLDSIQEARVLDASPEPVWIPERFAAEGLFLHRDWPEGVQNFVLRGRGSRRLVCGDAWGKMLLNQLLSSFPQQPFDVEFPLLIHPRSRDSKKMSVGLE